MGNAASGFLTFQTSDPYDVDFATQSLISGVTTFAVQMVQASTQSLSIYHTAGIYSTGTVSGITINAGAINRPLIIMPGEVYMPGKPPYTPASGGTGGKQTPDTPSAWFAGAAQPVVVYAVDAFWNLTSSAATVSLTTPSDPNAIGLAAQQMTGGTTTFNPILYKAVDYNGFTQGIVATIAGLGNPNYTSPAFLVYPDDTPSSARYLRIMANGETPLPGNVALKTGTPSGPAPDTHFVAGSTITFQLDATDTWGNRISTTAVVNLVTDDVNAKPSPSLTIPLLHGTTTFIWNWVTKTEDLAR